MLAVDVFRRRYALVNRIVSGHGTAHASEQLGGTARESAEHACTHAHTRKHAHTPRARHREEEAADKAKEAQREEGRHGKVRGDAQDQLFERPLARALHAKVNVKTPCSKCGVEQDGRDEVQIGTARAHAHMR